MATTKTVFSSQRIKRQPKVAGSRARTAPPHAHQQQETLRRLDSLAHNASTPILKVKNTFPFDLYPDQIVVYTNKVEIVVYNFFKSAQVNTTLIKDINHVTVNKDLVFAQFELETTGPQLDPPPVKFLKIKDAFKLRRIILGLITVAREGIDITDLNIYQILDKIEQIGKIQEPV